MTILNNGKSGTCEAGIHNECTETECKCNCLHRAQYHTLATIKPGQYFSFGSGSAYRRIYRFIGLSANEDEEYARYEYADGSLLIVR